MHQSPNLHGKSCSRESKFWSRRFRTRTIMLLPKEENHGTVVAAIEATNAQDRSIKTHNHQTRRIFGLNYRHTHDISQDPIGCLKLAHKIYLASSRQVSEDPLPLLSHPDNVSAV
ncbi:hypothetical protein PgNI_05624 [Pyricularia grisea]|uniref:Uncharacterized protein n=1 Tax=Pyricularia grisea TaxID=148305 RepID=A0A6P8B656_PYRGI|nr:hypothetical protein PgNI_05624 [Pyricularia grisea]TLD10604.1 hypothetical protein PgNI_05624 [Pyricularia grisea]